MNITYICDIDLHAFMGGVRHVLEVVKNMGRYGYNVRLYAPKYSRPDPIISFKNVEVIFIPTFKFRIINWSAFYIIVIFYLLRDFIIKGMPDFIYTRDMVYNILLPFFCRITRIPLLIEVNSILTDELEMIDKGRFEIGLIKLCQRLNFRLANGIISVTDGIKNVLVERYKIPASKMAVISNGTDAEHFRPIPQEEAREKTGLEKDKRYVGFVGSCYPYHDIPTLINAAPAIIERYPDVRFVIVGEGVARKEWEGMVREKGITDYFIFTGYKPYEIIPYYINAFEVCVAPFTIERNQNIGISPMKLFDYLACGKAVVGSDIREAGDILKTMNIGATVLPEDAKALAEAIIKLMENPNIRKEMGERGRELVLKEFTWEAKVKEIMSFAKRFIMRVGDKS